MAHRSKHRGRLSKAVTVTVIITPTHVRCDDTINVMRSAPITHTHFCLKHRLPLFFTSSDLLERHDLPRFTRRRMGGERRCGSGNAGNLWICGSLTSFVFVFLCRCVVNINDHLTESGLRSRSAMRSSNTPSQQRTAGAASGFTPGNATGAERRLFSPHDG